MKMDRPACQYAQLLSASSAHPGRLVWCFMNWFYANGPRPVPFGFGRILVICKDHWPTVESMHTGQSRGQIIRFVCSWRLKPLVSDAGNAMRANLCFPFPQAPALPIKASSSLGALACLASHSPILWVSNTGLDSSHAECTVLCAGSGWEFAVLSLFHSANCHLSIGCWY